MNVIAKLIEIEVYAEIMKIKLAELREELENQGKPQKKNDKKIMYLIAEAKAKRAISRLS